MALGFFDDELRFHLPHPPISLALQLVVENAVRAAWAILRNREFNDFELRTAIEPAITLKLHEVLADEVMKFDLVEGFDANIFETPIREMNVRNFNGVHPDKEPDLIIRIRHREGVRPSQDGIFVECKPVKSDHEMRSGYCDNGIARFVRGEYAWALLSASMFGYAKRGVKIVPKLKDALKEREQTIPTQQFPMRCDVSREEADSEAVHITRHGRPFRYAENGKEAPPITIRHLWLARD